MDSRLQFNCSIIFSNKSYSERVSERVKSNYKVRLNLGSTGANLTSKSINSEL